MKSAIVSLSSNYRAFVSLHFQTLDSMYIHGQFDQLSRVH